MGESFYSVLDIPADAGPDVVERAYRDQVKTHHPDVSDAPNAEQAFKRLTVARDTLVDETERARYDRLGHEAYVRQFAPAGLFEAEHDPDAPAEPAPAEGPRGATASAADEENVEDGQTVTDGAGTAWWIGREPDPIQTYTCAGRSSEQTVTSGIYGGQTRGRRGGGSAGADRSLVGGLGRALAALGPWIVLHLLLLVSVGVTGWFVLGTGPSLLSVVALVVLALGSLVASGLHLVSTVYA